MLPKEVRLFVMSRKGPSSLVDRPFGSLPVRSGRDFRQIRGIIVHAFRVHKQWKEIPRYRTQGPRLGCSSMRPLSSIRQCSSCALSIVLRPLSVLMNDTRLQEHAHRSEEADVRGVPHCGPRDDVTRVADVWWRNYLARRLKGFCQARAVRDLVCRGGPHIRHRRLWPARR
jgi:hypothetical protein